jgi:hypothetical protein
MTWHHNCGSDTGGLPQMMTREKIEISDVNNIIVYNVKFYNI